MLLRALLTTLVAAGLSGTGAAPAGAATFYGGGSLPASVKDAAPRFLVTVENGHASILGFSGGRCTNGRDGFRRFVTKRFRLRQGGRFVVKGSFAFTRPGGATGGGSYVIRGRVRGGSGVVSGAASVRLSFPDATTAKTIVCTSGSRAFRARNQTRGSRAHAARSTA